MVWIIITMLLGLFGRVTLFHGWAGFTWVMPIWRVRLAAAAGLSLVAVALGCVGTWNLEIPFWGNLAIAIGAFTAGTLIPELHRGFGAAMSHPAMAARLVVLGLAALVCLVEPVRTVVLGTAFALIQPAIVILLMVAVFRKMLGFGEKKK